MNEEKLKELREIVDRNPGVLDSLHPFEKQVAERLLSQIPAGKGTGRPKRGRGRPASSQSP